MVPPLSKLLLFVITALTLSPAHAEITPDLTDAVNEAIRQRKAIWQKSGPLVKLEARLKALETQIFPLAIWANRQISEIETAEVSIQSQMSEIRSRKAIRPYQDKIWLKNVETNLKSLCCDIKADPRWQQQIVERVSDGQPALGVPGEEPAKSAPD